MLKAIQLVKEVQGFWWTISPISGRLLKYYQRPLHLKNINIPERVQQALDLCNDPFKCKPSLPVEIDIQNSIKSLEKSYKFLNLLRQKSYYLSLLYVGYSRGLFRDSREAMAVVLQLCSNHTDYYQLCLPISLMTIKLSKSFKKNGVLIIGAFIPTGEMHAWIIEGDSQINFHDRQWINFHPLLVYIKE
jgi:hypothetical protein